jgi:hypothetical protein
VATGHARAGGAHVEDPGEAELPKVKPRLEVAHRSLVRPASSKSSAKGERGLKDEAGWSNTDGLTHEAPEAA